MDNVSTTGTYFMVKYQQQTIAEIRLIAEKFASDTSFGAEPYLSRFANTKPGNIVQRKSGRAM